MRALLLASVGLLAAACGGPEERLVHADVTPSEAEGCVVRESRARASTWTVREGESLRLIARRVYGNEALWKAIRAANPSKVGAGDVVRPGVVLAIPFDGV